LCVVVSVDWVLEFTCRGRGTNNSTLDVQGIWYCTVCALSFSMSVCLSVCLFYKSCCIIVANLFHAVTVEYGIQYSEATVRHQMVLILGSYYLHTSLLQ
jgi:hypothetical protein